MPEIKPHAASAVRHPRGAVLINGTPVAWESWDVSNNATSDADEFAVSIPMASLPKDLPIGQLADGRALQVEIRAGVFDDPAKASPERLTSLILGRTDDVVLDPVRGVVELSGRDLTGALIDRKSAEKFANLTASQIVTKVAERVGLTPVVTKTSTLAGRYYAIDHALTTREMSEWELLQWLAQQEDFVVVVSGRELYFGPRKTQEGPYVLQWQPPQQSGAAAFNGERLMLRRNLTVARDVTVTVRSWNPRSKTLITATYPRSKTKGAAPGTSGASAPDGFVRNIPGLTQEQALQRAQTIHAQITAHEMRMEATVPGDVELNVHSAIELRGTGTPFDQRYYPESISRRMSMVEGFQMTVRAKNRAPENEVTM